MQHKPQRRTTAQSCGHAFWPTSARSLQLGVFLCIFSGAKRLPWKLCCWLLCPQRNPRVNNWCLEPA